MSKAKYLNARFALQCKLNIQYVRKYLYFMEIYDRIELKGLDGILHVNGN